MASVLIRRQRGVSLVEVLVASVVLSIGLLGLAGLQASGLRVGQSSIHRGQAAQLAYDIVERMRVNAASASAYKIGLKDKIGPKGEKDKCTPVAECDLWDWRKRLEVLPAGTGSIDVVGRQVTIVVQWDDSRGAGALRTERFQLDAQLGN